MQYVSRAEEEEEGKITYRAERKTDLSIYTGEARRRTGADVDGFGEAVASPLDGTSGDGPDVR